MPTRPWRRRRARSKQFQMTNRREEAANDTISPKPGCSKTRPPNGLRAALRAVRSSAWVARHYRINGRPRSISNGRRGLTGNPKCGERLQGHHGNVGMVTGHGIFVVDVDLYHGVPQDSLDDLYDIGATARDAHGAYRWRRLPPLLPVAGTDLVAAIARLSRHRHQR